MTVARFSTQPADTGLYRREHEHDACGVAMVATMRGSAGHDIVVHALDALRNLDHRGATGADPLVGDGAGILDPGPRRVLPGRPRHRPARRPGPTPSAWPTSRWRRTSGPRPSAGSARSPSRRGCASLAWRDVPVTPDLVGPHRPRVHAVLPPALRRVRGRRRRHRARPPRLLPAQARRARGRGLLPVAVGPHRGLQGHADDRPARAVLPRPVRRALRLRAGPGPLALLDEHLPELAAGPPLPAHRAQRRDQHRQGQPQLDAGPREPGALRRHPRRPRADLPHLHARRLRLGDLRRGARAAPPRRPLAAPLGAHDDPRGLGEPRVDGPRPQGVLRVPLDLHGALGRPGLRDLHRRHAHRRGARPQRPAPRPLLGHRRRARRPRLRGRGPRPRARERRAPRAPPAGPDVPRRHRRRPHRQRRGGQVLPRRREALRGVAARRPHRARRPARPRAHHPHRRLRRAAPAHLRLHRGGAEDPHRADGPHRRRGARVDGHRHPDRRALRAAAARLRLLQPALRAGDQPAARRDPRGARHLARLDDRPRGQRPRRHAGPRPPGRAALPGASTTTSSRRSSTSTPTATCRATARSSSGAPTTSPAARRRCAPGSTRSSARSRPRSPGEPASSCCPTATPTATARRSPRCC